MKRLLLAMVVAVIAVLAPFVVANQDDDGSGVIDDKFNVLDRALPRRANPPKGGRIVLIAGKKSHGPGEHEYEKGCRLLKHCLDTASNVTHDTEVIVVTDGWPKDPGLLTGASTILLFCDGSDRDAANHPLLHGDRLAQMQHLMDKGVGLVVLHYALFVPSNRGGEQYLDWLGGYFDYDTDLSPIGPQPAVLPAGPPRGPPNDPKRWYSKLGIAETTSTPLARHPICRGVEPFKAKTEYYWRIRFAHDDRRLMPLLTFDEKRDDTVVAWAVQRTDGGRGFGFTGGHFHSDWQIESFRRLVLNALLWTANLDVPEEGVRSTLPAERN